MAAHLMPGAFVIRGTADGGLDVITEAGAVHLDAGRSEALLAFLLATRGLAVEPPRCAECGAELTAEDAGLGQPVCGECAGL